MRISFYPEIIAYIFGFPITNSLILAFGVSLFVLAGAFLMIVVLKLIPGKIQSVGEILISGIFDLTAETIGSREQAKKIFPLVTTIFIFILLNNWLGLLPGIGSLGVSEHGEFLPLFRSAASDLNTTLALALISLFAVHFYAFQKMGFKKHLSRFFVLAKGPIYFFAGVLEFIIEFAKILSFSFRLFGNIFAGEVLLLVIIFLIPFLAPFPFLLMEFFVGFVQALVFAALTLIFFKTALEENY